MPAATRPHLALCRMQRMRPSCTRPTCSGEGSPNPNPDACPSLTLANPKPKHNPPPTTLTPTPTPILTLSLALTLTLTSHREANLGSPRFVDSASPLPSIFTWWGTLDAIFQP